MSTRAREVVRFEKNTRRNDTTHSEQLITLGGRVAYAACGWAFVFAALSCYWALGGTAGADTVSSEIVQLAHAHVLWIVAVLWTGAVLKVCGGFVALALIRPWGRRVPR